MFANFNISSHQSITFLGGFIHHTAQLGTSSSLSPLHEVSLNVRTRSRVMIQDSHEAHDILIRTQFTRGNPQLDPPTINLNK